MKINNYLTIVNNELMEYMGEEPYYYIHAQFRNTINGEVRYFEREIKNPKQLRDEEFVNYIIGKIKNLIEEIEYNYQYSFIPYEFARYKFQNKKSSLKSWTPIVFYDNKEKEEHYKYLKMAQKKYEKREAKLYGYAL